jgi:hypothetical protein
LDRKRLAGSQDRVADGDTGGIFVDLF